MKLMDHLHWEDINDENLNFLKAIGVDCLLAHLPGELADGRDPTDEMRRVKKFVEDFGRDAGPILEVVEDLRDPIDLGGFGNWIRSFGNRDDFIDVHLFMFAAVDTNARDSRIALLPLAGFFGGATTSALRQRSLQAQFGSDSPRYIVTGSLNWATRGFVIQPGRVIVVD